MEIVTIPFSRRTAWDLGETAYACAVREALAAAVAVCDLTVSNPTRCGFHYPAEMAVLADLRALEYDPDPRGMRSAREAVAQYYSDHGASAEPDALVLMTSTSESYSLLFRLLCDPGDEVLIAQPSYPLFDFLAALDDVQLRSYPLFYDHGWCIDLAQLERSIHERTRAIVVIHPNNPTGHWTYPAARRQLEELCAAHGLALIVDEVFLDYPLDPAAPRPESFALGPHPALTFCLSGLSKIAGLPQMKAAWIAAFGPAPSRKTALARLEVIADTFLSINAPVQLALPAWLAQRGEMQQQILRRVRSNAALLESAAQRRPDRLRFFEPEAGWTAVVSLPGCGGADDCAEQLVRQRGVFVHPGSFYGMHEPNRAVISLLTPPEILAEGIARIAGDRL